MLCTNNFLAQDMLIQSFLVLLEALLLPLLELTLDN
jgi:hypothetical protein